MTGERALLRLGEEVARRAELAEAEGGGLSGVAAAVGRAFACGCSVLVFPEGEDVAVVAAIEHEDPDLRATLGEHGARRHVVSASRILGPVAAGEALLLDEEALRPARFANPDARAYVEQTQPRSAVAVPLRAGGRVAGTVILTRFADEPALTRDDLDALTGLAGPIAAALDEARPQTGPPAPATGEAWFAAAFAHAPIGMAIYDATATRVVDANPALCRLLKRSRDELRATHPAALSHPDDLRVGVRELEEVLAGRSETATVEKRLLRADGSPAWVRMHVARGPAGPDHGACVIAQVEDVSRERAAREGDAHLTAIVEHSQDAIVGLEPDGTVRSWNAAAERLFELPAGEIVGRSIDALVPPECEGDAQALIARVLAGESVVGHETVRMSAGGRRIPVSLTLSPVRDADGEVRTIAKVVRDVSVPQRRARQQQLVGDLMRSALEGAARDDLLAVATAGIVEVLDCDAAEVLRADPSGTAARRGARRRPSARRRPWRSSRPTSCRPPRPPARPWPATTRAPPTSRRSGRRSACGRRRWRASPTSPPAPSGGSPRWRRGRAGSGTTTSPSWRPSPTSSPRSAPAARPRPSWPSAACTTR